MGETPNRDFWSPAEKVQLQEYFRALGNCPNFRPAAQIEAERNGTLPPWQPPIFQDLRLLKDNASYEKNLGTREKNLTRTLDNLDVELIPLLDVTTHKPIEGFPTKLRQIDELGYDEGIRILTALGEPHLDGDEWTVIYRVRRWAASVPSHTEIWQEKRDAGDVKKGIIEKENKGRVEDGNEGANKRRRVDEGGDGDK